MTDAELEADLNALGYVKVMAVLKEPKGRAAAAFSKGPDEPDIGSYFMIPSEGLAASLRIAARRAANRPLRARAAAPVPRYRAYPRLGLVLGYVDRQGAAALLNDRRIDKVVKAPELSLIRPVAYAAAAPPEASTWGVRRLGVEALWDAGYTGEGVAVGHLDTGLDGSHPALHGAIRAFAEFDLTGAWLPGAKPRDSGWHGTHTAGTIVGRRDAQGAIGLAPAAQVVSGLVIEGGSVIDRILAGLEWQLSEGVRIISLSLGLRGFTPAFQVVVDALRANDVLPVVAVGNEYAGTSRSPGNYANVLSVGASDQDDKVADFSGSQRFDRPEDPLVPDIVAPGVAVLSCVPGGRYAESSGTSMATPHVAGLAALLLQARPDVSAQELEDAILASCSRPASMPAERANRGLPNAARAFAFLTGEILPGAVAAGRGRGKRKTALA